MYRIWHNKEFYVEGTDINPFEFEVGVWVSCKYGVYFVGETFGM